ncbi:MAG: MBOAT family O-acyltransferase [Planctomycetaceae bacterium]
MLFNSWQFALFLPVVVLVHFLLPHRIRWAWLLAASYLFYMSAVPEYGLLLLFSTVVDYWLGLAIHAAPAGERRRWWLLLSSLLTNLGMLGLFKYFNFFASSLAHLSGWLGRPLTPWESQLLLPVGISFYTFQTLSYSIDIYRGTLQPERHFGRYALYVAFFPQLVAGPIERASRLLPQLRQPVHFSEARAASGLKLMAWGFFMKLCIADHLAVFVNSVYSQPVSLSGPHYALATAFFAFQIYCDFAGYSLIAIGASRVLGYELMTNFDRPYSARSLGEFWNRWHISLSTWFRDYLYIPLGGSRNGVAQWYRNLAIVFLVSGLWHGARWTFVIWGALHATYLIVEIATRDRRAAWCEAIGLSRWPRLHRTLQQLTVFVLVCVAWVFFRADSLEDAWRIVSQLPTGWSHLWEPGWLKQSRLALGLSKSYFTNALLLIAVMELVQLWPQRVRDGWPQMFWLPVAPLRWVGYVALMLVILNLGAPKGAPFIYFQF